MKIYVFFLIYDKVQLEESFEWMKDNLWDDVSKEFHYIGNKRCLLYAYTDDKKMAEEFITYRNTKKFVMETYKMSKAEYADFYTSHNNGLLSRYTFYHGNRSIQLVLTQDEYGFYEGNMEWVEDEFEETVYAYPIMKEIMKMLKPKYQKLLKGFQIQELFDICNGIQIGDPIAISVNIVHFLLKWYRFTFI